jgi:hypothetical protein
VLIPFSVIQSLKDSFKSQESALKKFLKLLPSLLKTPYISLELAGQALFFFAHPYWQKGARAIYTIYVSLIESKLPDPNSLVIVGSLLAREKDPLKAFQIAAEIFNFSFSSYPDKLSKPPFSSSESELESETLKLLRLAAFNLRDLYTSNNLPQFCFAHHKIFWSSCPVCKKLSQKI